MEREITPEDRKRFEEFAWQFGHDNPDKPSPYRVGSGSHEAWRRGREARLMEGHTER